MADKKIDGSIVSAMMDAVEHLAKLEVEMERLRWRFCYYDDPANSYIVRKLRAHSRKLMEALGQVEYRMSFEEGKQEQEQEQEQERAIRAVK